MPFPRELPQQIPPEPKLDAKAPGWGNVLAQIPRGCSGGCFGKNCEFIELCYCAAISIYVVNNLSCCIKNAIK